MTYVVGCSFAVDGTWDYGNGTTPGIYRTTNGGTSWSPVSTAEVYQNPLVVNGTIYWPTAGGGIVKSADNGATWSIATASGMVSTRPTSLPNGHIAQLTTTKMISISADAGTPWTNVSVTAATNNPTSLNSGITYDAVRGVFFVWQGGSTSVLKFDYATGIEAFQPATVAGHEMRGNRPMMITNFHSLDGTETLFDISGKCIDGHSLQALKKPAIACPTGRHCRTAGSRNLH